MNYTVTGANRRREQQVAGGSHCLREHSQYYNNRDLRTQSNSWKTIKIRKKKERKQTCNIKLLPPGQTTDAQPLCYNGNSQGDFAAVKEVASQHASVQPGKKNKTKQTNTQFSVPVLEQTSALPGSLPHVVPHLLDVFTGWCHENVECEHTNRWRRAIWRERQTR